MAVNNVTLNPDTILQERRERKVEELIPVFVFVSILLFIGLFGNVSVLIFFFRKAKDSVSCFFIVVLAIVDTCACLMICLVIMDLSRPYKYTSDIGCKIHSFSKFFTGLCSILLLFTIAVERYRKTCCPFKRQLSMKGARIVVSVDVVIAFALSVIQASFYEVVEDKIQNDYNITMTGFSCRTTRNKEMRKYLTVVNGVQFFLLIVFASALVTLYSLQSRAIYRHSKRHARLMKTPEVKETQANKAGSSSGACGETSMNNNQTVASNLENKTLIPLQTVDMEVSKRGAGSVNKEIIRTENTQKKEDVNKDTISPVRVSIMFFVITVGFIVCFTPFMVYSLRRSYSMTNSVHSVSIDTQFLVNSYLVNSTLNFFVYIVVHKDFRRFFHRIFCCCRNADFVD